MPAPSLRRHGQRLLVPQHRHRQRGIFGLMAPGQARQRQSSDPAASR
jgi:hypothetical protein